MNRYNFEFSMNKHVAGACHIALWAFMFLSPMTYWRGTGITLPHYLMICMQPLLLMVVFYTNYLYLAPKLFVAGKHRYDLLINVVLITILGSFLHYWMDWVNDLFLPNMIRRYDDTLGTIAYILRDSLNLAVFAGGATALALARRWVTTNQKLKESEAARAQAELNNLRNQINPHFLLNTLNNIYALTAINAEQAQEAILQLSKLLRHMLYGDPQQDISLKNEVQFLENYINLMKLRLPATVDLQAEFHIQDSPLKVTPLLFISLVENAFKHGVSPSNPCFIHIKIEADKHQIVCDIRNSNNPKNQEDRSGHGIGLKQVQRRLDLSYPGRYVWEKGLSEDKKIYQSKIILNIQS